MKLYLYNVILALTILSCSAEKATHQKDDWGKKVKSENLKNLHKVNKNIYRSAQPNREGFKELKKIGANSVLCLRSKNVDAKLTHNLGLDIQFLKMDASKISEKDIINALSIIKKAPKPILVHCFHGSDRTGAVIAIYRVVYEDWSKKEAIDEMINGGFGFHKSYENIPRLINSLDVKSIREKLKKRKNLPVL